MSRFRFFLDEADIHVTCGTTSVDQQIDALSALIYETRARHRESVVEKSSTVYSSPLLNEFSVHDVLNGAANRSLPRDVRERLRIAIDRCPAWDQNPAAVTTPKIQIQGQDQLGETLRWAYYVAGQPTAVSCIGISPGIRAEGWQKVADSNQIERDLFFLKRIDQIREHFVGYLSTNVQNHEEFMAVASLAFPNLEFASGLGFQIRRFRGGFADNKNELIKHLRALDRGFARIFRENDGEPNRIQSYFRSEFNVDLSPESPKTRRDARAMRERQVTLGGRTFSCEWHTKITTLANRIYFHPGTPELFNGRVVIGIFHEHLST